MAEDGIRRVTVVDSHTGGEPTRVVISGGPDLGAGPLAARCAHFERAFDSFRSAVVNEPRGSDVMVGALLVDPSDPSCTCGVIFFNNVGSLGMCGHGAIGLIATLEHLGRIGPGVHRIETPVGVVTATLHGDRSVAVRNVPSFRLKKGVEIRLQGFGVIRGDIAWGGNWFYLVSNHDQEIRPENVAQLSEFTRHVRAELERAGVTGPAGEPIDHIELFSGSPNAGADSRNFVLCPGDAYDRSPCGTGTCAKMACLAADGELRPGQTWRQESIVGSIFEGSIEMVGEEIVPTIRGTAFVNAESTLLLNPADPFCMGIGAAQGLLAHRGSRGG